MKSNIKLLVVISMLLVLLCACNNPNQKFINGKEDYTTSIDDEKPTDNATDSVITTDDESTVEDTEDSTLTTEDTELSQSTIFSMVKKSHEGLNYWLYTPANAKAGMPLIVYLHGGSGKGNDLNLLTDVDGFPKYIKEGTLSADAYIVFPQCPSEQNGWNALSAKIEELIHYTCNEFSINTNKISITGHSMGGAGTWTLALSNPDLYYKIAPMSGSVKTDDETAQKLLSLSVWAFVGGAERSTTIDSTRAIIDALISKGADAQFTVLEGAAHFEVPAAAYLDKTLNIIEWLID